MDGFDLPLISDDELDYDLHDASDMPSGSKEQIATCVSSVYVEEEVDSQNAVTSTQTIFHQPVRKRRTNENIMDSDASDGEVACQDNNDGLGIEKFLGRLAGRVKRVGDKKQRIESLPREDDEIHNEDEEINEQFLGGFEQILDGKKDEHRRNLKDSELEALYTSLDVDTDDPSVRFNALYVTGAVEKMTTFDISRIFAQFKPETVRPLNSQTFIITFANAIETAQLLLDMTKPLRRVRGVKKPEEGELVDSSDEEEEEGQVKEEGGDDVAIVKDGNAPKSGSARSRLLNAEAVEVNVDTIKVPQGKWRVVVQHVPGDKLIYVRLASGIELRHAIYTAKSWENDGECNYRNTKIRPGLDVFDDKGKELDWDYEHDTRFFEEEKSTSPVSIEKPVENLEIDGVKIRSKGRGSKKFLHAFSNEDSD